MAAAAANEDVIRDFRVKTQKELPFFENYKRISSLSNLPIRSYVDTVYNFMIDIIVLAYLVDFRQEIPTITELPKFKRSDLFSRFTESASTLFRQDYLIESQHLFKMNPLTIETKKYFNVVGFPIVPKIQYIITHLGRYRDAYLTSSKNLDNNAIETKICNIVLKLRDYIEKMKLAQGQNELKQTKDKLIKFLASLYYYYLTYPIENQVYNITFDDVVKLFSIENGVIQFKRLEDLIQEHNVTVNLKTRNAKHSNNLQSTKPTRTWLQYITCSGPKCPNNNQEGGHRTRRAKSRRAKTRRARRS